MLYRVVRDRSRGAEMKGGAFNELDVEVEERDREHSVDGGKREVY
jgi:hypothetical protein